MQRKYGVATFLLLVGCIDPVTLGRECFRLGDCMSAAGPPPTATSDASFFDASSAIIDASYDAAVDALVEDAGLALPLPVDNGSFELTGGQYGALALEAFDPIPIGANVSAPWQACRLGFDVRQQADSLRGSGAGDVRPTEGLALIEADLGIASALAGLQQQLPTPLEAGQRYAFRIDARAAVGSAVTVEVRGTHGNCSLGTKLTDLGMLSEAWTSQCVSFVAPSDMSTLLLLPMARGTSTMTPARVFFDNVRSGCP